MKSRGKVKLALFLPQCFDFLSWAGTDIGPSLLTEEEELSGQAVCPSALLERRKMGILPVADPRQP